MQPEKPVVLISGGSRGLGIALCNRCIQQGYRVATLSRNSSDAIQYLLKKESPENFHWESIDVTNEVGLNQFVGTVLNRFGKIDMLVNNIGMAVDGIFAVTRFKEIAQCIDFNFKSIVHLTQLCSKAMLRQKAGNIINISSVNAIRGHSGVAVYSATKAALDGFTRSLARELGACNIRVNSIAPGYFESDMVKELNEEGKNRIKRRTPLGRLATIQEIVDSIMFMLSPQSSFITGQTLVVDGGITC